MKFHNLLIGILCTILFSTFYVKADPEFEKVCLEVEKLIQNVKSIAKEKLMKCKNEILIIHLIKNNSFKLCISTFVLLNNIIYYII